MKKTFERGFACIALDSPKFPENVGAVLRAAHCYRVAQVNLARCRAVDLENHMNTPMAHRHTPVFMTSDPLEYLPHDCQVVAVDLVNRAEPLTTFKHPQRAMYVFGAEDATLGQGILKRAQRHVYVPTQGCMNLAATVNVVLYDRMLKGGAFTDPYKKNPSRDHYGRSPEIADA